MAVYLSDILSEFASKNKDKRIIFPDIDDERIHDAVAELITAWDHPVICGKKHELERYQALIDTGLEYFEVTDDEKNEVFAAKKLSQWEVGGFLWGNISTTTDIARALIKNVGSAPDIKRASSHFLFGKENKEVFLYSDGWFQIDPTPEQLAEITLLTTQNAIAYGMTPRIAMLSFSTAGSGGEHPMILKMQEATNLAKELLKNNNLGHIPLEGEVQFDAALIPEIGKNKNPETTLTEPANVFIFPDLGAANIAYKITQRLGSYQALGPILQWFAKPANDLSRGCSVEDIVQMYHITKNS